MLSTITEIKFELVPLDRIRVDPLLTPKALEIPRHLEGDRPTRDRYYALASEFKYIEPLKLGIVPGEFMPALLSNYESYQALQEVYHAVPSTLVPSMILTFDDAITRKALATHLSGLERSQQPYLARLYELYHYLRWNLDGQMIRRIYGINRSASAEGRQLRRDLTIAKHLRFLGHILGIQGPDVEFLVSARTILKPNIGNATLTYSLSLRILQILGSDSGAVDKFLDYFEKYLLELKKSHMSPEEETKPVHQWSSYNKARIESFAKAVATDRAIPSCDIEELCDYQWGIGLDERSGIFSIPQTKYNVHDQNPVNVRRMVEIAYKAKKLSQSLEAHLSRIRPVRHGGRLKVGESSVEPRIPVPSNIPKLEDADYVNAVRRDKMLAFCNRGHLLRCLHLWASIFGFESSAPDAVSTWENAATGFEKWYSESFLADVFRYHQNNDQNHPFYRTYVAIRAYLSKHGKDPAMVSFSEFINDLFSHVFISLDRDEENHRARAEDVVRFEGKLKDHSWVEIKSKLDKGKRISLDKQQLESIIRERIHAHEKSVVRAIGAQNQILSRVVENPLLLGGTVSAEPEKGLRGK